MRRGSGLVAPRHAFSKKKAGTCRLSSFQRRHSSFGAPSRPFNRALHHHHHARAFATDLYEQEPAVQQRPSACPGAGVFGPLDGRCRADTPPRAGAAKAILLHR